MAEYIERDVVMKGIMAAKWMDGGAESAGKEM